MSSERIEMLQSIRDFLAEERGTDPDAIQEDTQLHDLGLDSLDLAEMAMEWEDRYGVLLDDGDIAAIKTFGDAIDRVLLGRAPAAVS